MAQIHEALAEIMKEVPNITKDRRNQQQGFQYRGIDDVYAAVHPLFVKHGVFSVPTVESERSEDRTSSKGNALIYRVLKVRYDFYAKDGSSVSATVIGEGMDSGDKASNKALAVAHKYAILQVLSIPTEENIDPDAEAHEVKPKITKPTPLDPGKIDLIKGILADRDLCPTEIERDALKQEVWRKYNGNLDAILKDLEERQLRTAGRKSA